MRSINTVSSVPFTVPASKLVCQAPGQPESGCQNGGIWGSVGQSPNPITGPITCHPIVQKPGEWRKHNDVAQLDKAEALAQDAVCRAAAANNSPAQLLQAQDEMQQAQLIRARVGQDLTPSQQQKLDDINSEEQRAFLDSANPDRSPIGDLGRTLAPHRMADAAAKSKALDQSSRPSPRNIPSSRILT
jgi:hypothetical protein